MSPNVEVLSITYDEDGTKRTKCRLKNCGATFTNIEPPHTPEEQQAIWDNFVYACAQLLYPGKDLSNVEHMRLLNDCEYDFDEEGNCLGRKKGHVPLQVKGP